MGKLMVGNDGSVMDIDPRDEPAAVRHGFVDYGSPEHLSAMGVAAPGMGVSAPVPPELQKGHGRDMYGNPTIEPLPGEDTPQTMRRAVAYNKTLPPAVRARQMQREMQNAPEKVTMTMAAAPLIGAAGAAGLTGAGIGAARGATAATNALGFTGAPWPTGVAQALRTGAGVAGRAAGSPTAKLLYNLLKGGLTLTAAWEIIKNQRAPNR